MANWWEEPALTGVGRLPMRPPLVDRAGPFFRSLDGRWRFSLAARPDAAPAGFETPDFDDGGWSEVDVPGCFTMQGYDRPIYTNIAMPFRTFPPDVPDANPTGCYRTTFVVPSDWQGRRVVIHIGAADERAAAVGERRRGRHQQGLPARSRVRPHRRRAVRRVERARGPGRPLVRRFVPRRPGPVVAGRHPPRGLPLQHAAHLPGGRARERIALRRTRRGHARPARRCLVRGSCARRRLGRSRAVRNRTRRSGDARTPRARAAHARRVPLRRTHRSPPSRRARRRAVVGRDPEPLPAARGSRRSRRQRTRQRDPLDRIPASRRFAGASSS